MGRGYRAHQGGNRCNQETVFSAMSGGVPAAGPESAACALVAAEAGASSAAVSLSLRCTLRCRFSSFFFFFANSLDRLANVYAFLATGPPVSFFLTDRAQRRVVFCRKYPPRRSDSFFLYQKNRPRRRGNWRKKTSRIARPTAAPVLFFSERVAPSCNAW